MAAKNIEALKQQLIAEKQRLEALIGRTSKHLYRRDEPYNADFAEQAVETQNNEVVEHIDREAQRELEQVNKALQRIDTDAYGWCTCCGNAISKERLAAIPSTEYCIHCADTH